MISVSKTDSYQWTWKDAVVIAIDLGLNVLINPQGLYM